MRAKAIRAELLTIKAISKDGMLHAEKVVAWAKSHRNSALHSRFEWSNDKAAREYRLWQARSLIQIYVVTEEGEPNLVSLRFDRPRGGGYRDVADVVSNRDLSAMMLKDAIADLERVRERFKFVRELLSVWKALDAVKTKPLAHARRPQKKAA